MSIAAQKKVNATDGILDQSEKVRQQVEDMINNQHSDFERKNQENDKNLNEINGQITGLGDKIADINEMVSKRSVYNIVIKGYVCTTAQR